MMQLKRHTTYFALFVLIFAAIYLAFLAYLYIFQDSFVFFPRKTTDERWTEIIEELRGDYVSIQADDGEVLEGIFLSDKTSEEVIAKPTVIFFGGNAMRVEDIIYEFRDLPAHDINVLLMDYRGYGLSTGKPHTNSFKRDAQKIFDAAASHPSTDPDRITVWGISLGTGIALHLAAAKTPEKVILFAPFTSTTDIAREAYPFAPVSMLLKHKLDNLALAPYLKLPVLIVHGEDDNQINPSHSEKIAEAWGGNAEFILLPERGHNDLMGDSEAWEEVVEFLKDGAAEEI